MAPVQTSYDLTLTEAIEGQLADNGEHDVAALYNEEASASIAFGRGVRQGANDNGALLPSLETQEIIGVTLHANQYTKDSASAQLDATGMRPDVVMNVLRKGRVWVRVRTGATKGQRAFCRCTAAPGSVGQWENADDGTETIDCTGQAVFRSSAAADGLAILEVDFTNEP
jgi:hypothetical protein